MCYTPLPTTTFICGGVVDTTMTELRTARTQEIKQSKTVKEALEDLVSVATDANVIDID